ncbi:MAG: hypothetical protein WAX89_07715 [Alphaproteobacteria bacterium]
MIWVLCALLLSIQAAVFAEVNRVMRLDGGMLNFWRLTVGSMLLLPAVTLVPWPSHGAFYVAALLSGAVTAVSSSVRMNLTRKRKGRVSTLFMPLEAFVGFGLWFAIDQNFQTQVLARPYEMLMVGACFLLVTAAMAGMRRNDASWSAFVMVAPLGILHAVSGVVAKTILMDEGMMPEVNGWQGVVLYVFLLQAFAAGWAAMLNMAQQHRKPTLWLPQGMVLGAFIYGVLGVFGMMAYSYGVIHAPNPGYITAIAMLAPTWLLMWHRLIGYEEEGSPVAGFLMVIAAIILVMVTVH